MSETESSVDPVDLEVVRNRESSIMQRQADTIVNLSGQPLFMETADFSCGLLGPQGEIIGFHAFFLPHIGSLSAMVRATIDEYGMENINPGDVFWCSDPYEAGGLHQPDNGAIAPVFDDDENLVCWIGDLAHITDVGGYSAGAFTPVPTEVVQEAIRVPSVKIYDQDEWQDDLFRLFLNNVRLPERVGLDMKGVIGAAYEARKMMQDVIDEYDGDYVSQLHETLLNRSERQARNIISELPDGTYVGRSYVESNHQTEKMYRIVCELTVEGDELTVDFSNSSEQAPAGGINSTEVGLEGGVGAMVATMVCSGEPFTGGSMRPVTIESEKGTIVNAEPPAPVSSASVTSTWYIMDAMMDAINKPLLASPYKDRATGTWSTWSFFMFYCVNQLGDPWISLAMEGGSGGGGAFPQKDGEDLIGSSSTITATLPNVEGIEVKSPFLYLFRRYLPDSGGPGKHRGGNGFDAAFVLHKDKSDGMTITTNINGKSNPGFGLMGGHPGGGTKIGKLSDEEFYQTVENGEYPNWVEFERDVKTFPTRDANVPVGSEETVYIQSKGGSGYGDPLERPPEHVMEDVEAGMVSQQTAEDVYGVVLENGDVNIEGTEQRREEKRSERANKGGDSDE